MRGLSWSMIAESYGLSERQCQAILSDYRASHPRLRERDPIEIVDEMLDRYEATQEELALVSATTKHDATRVGAIRTRLHALDAQTNLLMLVGVLPRDLGMLRHSSSPMTGCKPTQAQSNPSPACSPSSPSGSPRGGPDRRC
jgi:hypothetical protein